MFPNGRFRQGRFLPVAFRRVDHPAGHFRQAALLLVLRPEPNNHSRAAMHLQGRSRRKVHKLEIVSLQAGEALPSVKSLHSPQSDFSAWM